MIVLDSSALVDFLTANEPKASWVDRRISAEDVLAAPHLIDVEIVGALRRLVATSVLDAGTADQVVLDLAGFDLERYPHVDLLERVWQLRHHVRASDATFVALAEALDVPLVTTDARLGRARGFEATVVAFAP